MARHHATNPKKPTPYLVGLRLREPKPTMQVEIKAFGVSLALKLAESFVPGYEAETIDGRAVVGRCRRCETFVLEGERFRRQAGGGVLCEDCR